MERLQFDGWSVPNPLCEELHDIIWKARHSMESLTQADMHNLAECAENYLHFASHPAPTYMAIKKLRAIRKRARELVKDRK